MDEVKAQVLNTIHRCSALAHQNWAGWSSGQLSAKVFGNDMMRVACPVSEGDGPCNCSWTGAVACRDDFVVATKVSGPGNMPWMRGGPEALNARAISEAVDGSLARLDCDHIDLYQLHWPDRYVYGCLAKG